MAETFKGIWISKKVADFEKLSWTEKVLISDISSVRPPTIPKFKQDGMYSK